MTMTTWDGNKMKLQIGSKVVNCAFITVVL